MKIVIRIAQTIGFIVIFAVAGFFIYRQVSATVQRQQYTEEVQETVPRDELTRTSTLELAPLDGDRIAYIYEAYLSPQQEGGEEEDTPSFIPDVFQSTQPSVDRDDRPARGHGVLEFNAELSVAYMHLALENIDPTTINMLHIHCGRPGQLGPILVDFALIGDIETYLEDGVMELEIRNEDIERTAQHGEGIIGAFTAGCPIHPNLPTDKVKTIGGMEYIARQGELYFNVHTYAQTFFGDIRGQIHHVRDVPME